MLKYKHCLIPKDLLNSSVIEQFAKCMCSWCSSRTVSVCVVYILYKVYEKVSYYKCQKLCVLVRVFQMYKVQSVYNRVQVYKV